MRETAVELAALNVLVGPNGAGKSNVILALRLLQSWAAGQAAAYVAEQGGADALLHGGRHATPRLSLQFSTPDGFSGTLEGSPDPEKATGMHFQPSPGSLPEPLRQSLASIHVFHFKDLLPRRRAVMEAPRAASGCLAPGAANLGPCLLWLRDEYPDSYRRIVDTIRLVAPFFADFVLEERGPNVRLRWREQDLEVAHAPEALSDGTVRFISLATLLLQPSEHLPPLILLDEPELGLHPWAAQILAELIAGAAAHTQMIVSTQSVTLLNAFRVEDAIIVERSPTGTLLRHPDPAALAAWSDDAPLGALWEANLLGGTP